MKTLATVLIQIVVVVVVAHATACSTTAKKRARAHADADADAARAALVQELDALVAQGPLYFETDTDLLTDASQILLQRIAAQMNRVPHVRVTIAGHADERGDTNYNLSLGERRGYAARDYLVRLGIPKHRIRVRSLGEEQPIALGHDHDSWAQNRRDEFTFLLPSASAISLELDDAVAAELLATSSFTPLSAPPAPAQQQ